MSPKMITAHDLNLLTEVITSLNTIQGDFGPTFRGYVRLDDEKDSISYQVEFNVDSGEHVIVF
jgi:hypothetical protein